MNRPWKSGRTCSRHCWQLRPCRGCLLAGNVGGKKCHVPVCSARCLGVRAGPPVAVALVPLQHPIGPAPSQAVMLAANVPCIAKEPSALQWQRSVGCVWLVVAKSLDDQPLSPEAMLGLSPTLCKPRSGQLLVASDTADTTQTITMPSNAATGCTRIIGKTIESGDTRFFQINGFPATWLWGTVQPRRAAISCREGPQAFAAVHCMGQCTQSGALVPVKMNFETAVVENSEGSGCSLQLDHTAHQMARPAAVWCCLRCPAARERQRKTG